MVTNNPNPPSTQVPQGTNNKTPLPTLSQNVVRNTSDRVSGLKKSAVKAINPATWLKQGANVLHSAALAEIPELSLLTSPLIDAVRESKMRGGGAESFNRVNNSANNNVMGSNTQQASSNNMNADILNASLKPIVSLLQTINSGISGIDSALDRIYVENKTLTGITAKVWDVSKKLLQVTRDGNAEMLAIDKANNFKKQEADGEKVLPDAIVPEETPLHRDGLDTKAGKGLLNKLKGGLGKVLGGLGFGEGMNLAGGLKNMLGVGQKAAKGVKGAAKGLGGLGEGGAGITEGGLAETALKAFPPVMLATLAVDSIFRGIVKAGSIDWDKVGQDIKKKGLLAGLIDNKQIGELAHQMIVMPINDLILAPLKAILPSISKDAGKIWDDVKNVDLDKLGPDIISGFSDIVKDTSSFLHSLKVGIFGPNGDFMKILERWNSSFLEWSQKVTLSVGMKFKIMEDTLMKNFWAEMISHSPKFMVDALGLGDKLRSASDTLDSDLKSQQQLKELFASDTEPTGNMKTALDLRKATNDTQEKTSAKEIANAEVKSGGSGGPIVVDNSRSNRLSNVNISQPLQVKKSVYWDFNQ